MKNYMENKKEISLYKSGKVYSELEIEKLQKNSTSSKFIEQEYASMTGIKGNETMQELLEKYGIPCLGGEEVFAEVDKYGYTYNGICSGFKWKDTVSEISNEDAWKIIALSSIYWKKRYEKWYEEQNNKNERLKDQIAELESENERLSKKNYHLLEKNRDLIRVCDTCRISIKKFSERLKEHPTMKIYSLHNACERIPMAIDETLKEFLGEKK